MTRAIWTNEAIELLKQVYKYKTANELKEMFPQYTREQIYRKAKHLGLKKDELVAKKSRVENSIIQRQDLWSDEEMSILREVYPEFGAEGVAKAIKERLGKIRTETAIVSRANNYYITRKEKNVLVWTIQDFQFEVQDSFSVTVNFKGW